MLLPNRFMRRHPLHLSQKVEKISCHRQTFDEFECLRNIAEELNDVAVDLYRRGDNMTAIDLYKNAAKAMMTALDLKDNTDQVIDDELRASYISHIIRGKQQLYKSTLPSQTSSSTFDRCQWSESGVTDSPIYLSGALKIRNDDRQGSDEAYMSVATIMYNTALIHMKNSYFANAEGCYELVLECYDAIRSHMRMKRKTDSFINALVFAGLFNNIGYMQYRQGNIAEAIENFTRALNLGKKRLRQTSRKHQVEMMQGYKDVGTIYYNIGIAYARLGRTDKVIRPLEGSLELHKVALGDSHPDMATVQHSIGTAFMGIGQMDNAMNAFLESLRIIRFVFGNDDKQAAKALFYLGKVHAMKGEYDEALHAYEETLRVERLTLGMNHLETIMTMYEIGQIYQNKGDHDKVLMVYHDILSMAKVASDIEESSLVLILGEVVMMHLEVGNIDAATKIYNEVSSIIELKNDDHAITVIVELAQIKDMLMNPLAAPAA